MKKDYFAGRIAEDYDNSHSSMFADEIVSSTVDFMVDLADGGKALEFGIGTGRIGLPLRKRGVPVSGIELSPDMVAQLRQKPGSEDIEVAIGDFANTRVDDTFTLAYLVFNTISNLTTQDEQVECFRNAAAHLEKGGCFVIEVGVPELRQLYPGHNSRVFGYTETHVGIDEFDIVNQGLVSHHYTIRNGEGRLHSIPFRYAFPAEFDLMARIAGMKLRDRWSEWDYSPFTADSKKHISVWEKVS